MIPTNSRQPTKYIRANSSGNHTTTIGRRVTAHTANSIWFMFITALERKA